MAKYKSHVYKSVTKRSRDSRDVATVHCRRGRRRRQEDVLTVARPEAVVLATRTTPPNVSSTVDSTSTGHSNGDDSEAQSFATACSWDPGLHWLYKDVDGGTQWISTFVAGSCPAYQLVARAGEHSPHDCGRFSDGITSDCGSDVRAAVGVDGRTEPRHRPTRPTSRFRVSLVSPECPNYSWHESLQRSSHGRHGQGRSGSNSKACVERPTPSPR